MAKLISQYFSGSGSWTAPAGVTRVWVLAHGGGSGGSGGNNTTFDTAVPGYGTVPFIQPTAVVPNTSYTITIGAGGTGGAARTSFAQNGGAGGNTTFGALLTFSGGPALSASASNVRRTGVSIFAGDISAGGSSPFDQNRSSGFATSVAPSLSVTNNYTAGCSGCPGWTGSTVGARGASGGLGTGSAGGNASGFGAGGGSGGGGATGGGVGGNGAPGQLWVIWVE